MGAAMILNWQAVTLAALGLIIIRLDTDDVSYTVFGTILIINAVVAFVQALTFAVRHRRDR